MYELVSRNTYFNKYYFYCIVIVYCFVIFKDGIFFRNDPIDYNLAYYDDVGIHFYYNVLIFN